MIMPPFPEMSSPLQKFMDDHAARRRAWEEECLRVLHDAGYDPSDCTLHLSKESWQLYHREQLVGAFRQRLRVETPPSACPPRSTTRPTSTRA